jgi:MinD superfamily P-loop ATPase
MKIAIASGKGGTGKTTIATNLARSITNVAEHVQYIDCDVEEPNGHIFLKPNIEQTQEVTIVVPNVDTELCNGCGKCGQLCQYSAIITMKEIVMTFDQLCHSCGGCMKVCPTGAITEKPKVIGYSDIGSSDDGVIFSQGRLRIGDIHTPPLIKKVKATAIQDGVVIIDAPPGTSCPVIEAVRGSEYVLLVTEPTPFGLNDLKLAVGMIRELNIPFGVVINRSEPGEQMVNEYCRDENIEVIFEIPDNRKIAEAYSVGKMTIDVLPEYREKFIELFENISKQINC